MQRRRLSHSPASPPPRAPEGEPTPPPASAKEGEPPASPKPADRLPPPKFTPFEQYHSQKTAIRFIGTATAAGAAILGSASAVLAPAAVVAAMPAAVAVGAVGAAGVAAMRRVCVDANSCG
eukprot:TRINITY_DN43035_c0_g1_i1.p2 TRINITY_DN43035_c0_g1~~TRINITY_DN43035_c0_g1_i1.p2  ORF type:complete len:121 (+),score=26.46 TRINITY_DN43035_c0_g1_i1:55-417(+)